MSSIQRDESTDLRSVFGGVRPVLHLPFGDGPGEPILHDELARLVRSMAAAGVDGLVALGLASEASALSEEERDAVLETIVGTLARGGAGEQRLRGSLIVGIDGPSALARDRAIRAARAGASGLMVLPPRGSPIEDLAGHFGAVADASGLPVLVQDSPQATGVRLDGATILAVGAAHPLVRAVKIEAADSRSTVATVTGGGMAVVAGWGGLEYLDFVAQGAIGVMPGCDLGPAFVTIDHAARHGDTTDALAAYRDIEPLLRYETVSLERLILGAKRSLVRRGVFTSGRLRSPGRSIEADEAGAFDDLFATLEARGVPGFSGAGQ